MGPQVPKFLFDWIISGRNRFAKYADNERFKRL
jgi:hypothetical protein